MLSGRARRWCVQGMLPGAGGEDRDEGVGGDVRARRAQALPGLALHH